MFPKFKHFARNNILLITTRKQSSFRKRQQFIDKLRIHARGGAGGQGFPKYGGIGGKGGDVIVRAQKGVRFQTLLELTPDRRYTAGTGRDSSRRVLLGSPGEDQVIPVPVGVTVITDQGRILGDLNQDGDKVVVAHGGVAGGPDNEYKGRKGEALNVVLDLKLIADIGLVGFPNAGKSTFLSSISRATPKIADYAFTTIKPQIGIMEYEDLRQITVADLPGLIEGAHVNFGMGHKFLKHVERTKLLLFMVDINGFQLSRDYERRNAFETILLLNKELELFDPELLHKPAVIALNKIDEDKGGQLTDGIVDQIKRLPDSLEEVDESIRPTTLMKFNEVCKISTMFDLNTLTLKNRLRRLLDIYADLEVQNDKQRRAEMKEILKQERVLGREHQKSELV